VPVGYLIAVGVAAAGMALSLRPLARSGRLGTLSWLLSAVANESPFAAFAWVLGVTLLALVQGDLASPAGWAGLAVAGVSFLGTPVLVARSLRARAAIDDALGSALGPRWRARLDPDLAARMRGRLPWARILVAPLPFFHPDVARSRGRAYGEAGRRNLVDVYRHRSRPAAGPILIHLHGGGFRYGRRSLYARALLLELARHGWVCLSAGYRLRPAAVFPDYLVDAKKVIAWAREHAREWGADPDALFVAGSSAGAHLAVTAALTENDASFQPGFEEADTRVSAAVGIEGYYGPVDTRRQPLPSSPADYAHPGAPPIMIVHGAQDTFVPPAHAREFVARLRSVSSRPVVYAELPGGQHSLDLLHSIRFELAVDGIEAFAAWVRGGTDGRPARAPGRDQRSSVLRPKPYFATTHVEKNANTATTTPDGICVFSPMSATPLCVTMSAP
jgi:acetyl esterase/lipase